MYAYSYVLAKILLTLSAHFPEEVVDQWFADAEVIECTEDRIILYSPSPANLKNLQEQCYPYILELTKNLLQCNAILEIWGPQELEKHKQSQIAKPNYIKPEFLFSNFVVGTSNEMALETAKVVAADPGNNTYNPLYIYGPSGVGKTHLLCAIANEIRISIPKANVCYILADAFVGELIWSLRSGKYDEFRHKYRSADVFIVDDIQFLAGKASTQEEIYHIFDYLYQNNKQLILSANAYPSAIPGLENYLYSKFEQGIAVGIDPPDFQIRKTIVTQLAHDYKLDIREESILYIAETISGSVRKIIGSMKWLRAAHDLENKCLSEDNIKSILFPQKHSV